MPKLCVISIYVSDLELAKQFYCGKLGFEVSRKYDANTVSLKHENIPIVLYQVEQPARTDYPQQAQVVLGLETDNLAGTMAKLAAQGIQTIYDTPQPCPPGAYNAFRDPFGNVIELLEFSRQPSGQ
ncbi:VOC family protein [Paenibacillus thiaminolyticus]|uniref:VOC family protein n=1 Tax=Paenibacillus thiaminolyticus TaxID=49283 RepID=UPI00233070AA|nr:VOC family protein [Paenibacillus thiaminolyticus]WCF10774.1 VOC family protein [Paenibacillus thiaminolyticus]